MLFAYLLIGLALWVMLGFAFTLLLWPVIAKHMDRDYPYDDRSV